MSVGDQTVIQVRDDGPGISPAMLDRLGQGQRFTLSGHGRGGSSSTGLGLNIVQEIIKAMHGRLVLTNRPEGGLSAELHLPHKATH